MIGGAIVFVKGCFDQDAEGQVVKMCPFYTLEEAGVCLHPGVFSVASPAFVPVGIVPGRVDAPDWCPLVRDPVLVRRM